MRPRITVATLVAAVAAAVVADLYLYEGAYSRTFIHSLRSGFFFLVNNW